MAYSTEIRAAIEQYLKNDEWNYTFDEENYELSGELTKKIYHLGQKVRVRVADADALSRTVDFTIVE